MAEKIVNWALTNSNDNSLII